MYKPHVLFCFGRQRELKAYPPYLPVPSPRVLVGDKDSGPIEFEFETLGIPSGRRIRQRRASVMVGHGEEEEEVAASVDSEQFDSRVTVCKPVSSHDPHQRRMEAGL